LLLFHPLRNADTETHSTIGLISPIDTPTMGSEDSPSQKLHAELAALRHTIRQRYGIQAYVAQSSVMTRVLEQIALARNAGSAVHLRGPTGSGKQHTARLIHYGAAEQRGAFVPLDCRRLPARELKSSLKHLLEGEHPSGVASGLKPGAVYLLDVEYTPRDLQQTVLDGLEQASWLRWFSASTMDVSSAVEDDRLRVEFYYKLTTLSIELPELSARRDDVLPLAQHFLEQLNRGQERQISGFSQSACEQLEHYNWPGQLLELQRVIEAAWHGCADDTSIIDRLPHAFEAGMDFQTIGPEPAPASESLEDALRHFERRHILQALKQAQANKSRAAQLLGINRARLYRRMQALHIDDVDPS
jgi:two-component system response regulator HydG